MSEVSSSGAVDGGRIRRSAARIVREQDVEMRKLVAMLQDQHDVPERRVRRELNKCFDAELLYRSGDRDDAEVSSP